ncbi:nucleotide sugar dehydrogenase [Chelativorans sp. ZYF759]|uniref:UDP-glucose dehydrogenase family protein n=1 Tax=Chelativorans sp. ZYF759 TaxID=2692213 RepID=UPI00145C433D|nr:UDP-glucose/GDP-mannose dehydrogenase family protein [Chelativorans sp. ZYF759]NMG42016.1 nucleotide sugar dehydrogenase [Chelativorans sp. ZYF759]
MKITVFGTGYVGLVQAAALADSGHDVLCLDIDAEKVALLDAGRVPFYEPGLENLVTRNREEQRLAFTTDAAAAAAHGQIQFIAVGTPPDEDGSADLRHVLAVAETIGRFMQEPSIVVVKSTVPVGTSEQVASTIRKQLAARGRQDIDFDVASNPEFLKEGSAVADCLKPDRIIVGTARAETERVLRDLYAPFNRHHEKIIVMDVRSAELTKYAANCMLATRISTMNEIANLADLVGADIELVRRGVGSDPRIGYDFLYAGAGFGGACFPKDLRALICSGGDHDYDMKLLKATESRNIEQKGVLAGKIVKYFGSDLAGKCFALWGLAFKPNTDDMREAPSRALMEELWRMGAIVRAYDPKAGEACKSIYGVRDDLHIADSKEEALTGADALIIITEWKSFSAPDFDLIRTQLKRPVIFDGRNLYDPSLMARHGIEYFGIGRRSLHGA